MQNQRRAAEPQPPPVLRDLFPQRSLCRLVSCPRKLNAAISTRGTFEDCYMNIPLLRRGSPHPFILFLPFQAVSLRNGRCVFVDLMGVILTQQRETDEEDGLDRSWKGGCFWGGLGAELHWTWAHLEQHLWLWRLFSQVTRDRGQGPSGGRAVITAGTGRVWGKSRSGARLPRLPVFFTLTWACPQE